MHGKTGALAGSRATKTAMISVLAILAVIVLAVGEPTWVFSFRKPLETEVEGYRREWAYGRTEQAPDQEKTTQMRQVKQTDEIAVEKHSAAMTKGALLQPADPKKPRPATVAFS